VGTIRKTPTAKGDEGEGRLLKGREKERASVKTGIKMAQCERVIENLKSRKTRGCLGL